MKAPGSSEGLRGIPFQRQPWLAAAVAVSLFVAVFVLRLAVHGSQDHITSLYVFPIALLAVAFGLRVGAIAGATGVSLVAVWVAAEGVSLSPLGWFDRAAPLLLLGLLVGQATDRLRTAAATEQALFASRLREREAAEINDSIVQRLAVAKWSLEAGRGDQGLEVLTETIVAGQSLVAALLRGERLSHGNGTDVEPGAPGTAAPAHAAHTDLRRRRRPSTSPSPAFATRSDPAPSGP